MFNFHDSGDTENITMNSLSFDDPDSDESQTNIVLATHSRLGQFTLDDSVLEVGDRFSQADVDSGLLRY